MVVDGGQIDPCGGDDLPQRRRGVSLFGNQLLGGIENLLLRVNHSID